MNVLIACEESQRVCIEFRKLGHRAFSCDIQACSGGHPEWHIMDDVLKYINGYSVDFYRLHSTFRTQDGSFHIIPYKWDLIIAHPPCTYMSKAGARFMYPTSGNVNEDRLFKALEAKKFFLRILNANCDKICVENPTPLKIVNLPKESQVIQPFQFGHPYSKRTLLWLKGLPNLTPTNIVDNYQPFLPSNSSAFAKGKGGSRGVAHNAKVASKTFEGIARAMAEQWGI